jgi:hypothetical protein
MNVWFSGRNVDARQERWNAGTLHVIFAVLPDSVSWARVR